MAKNDVSEEESKEVAEATAVNSETKEDVPKELVALYPILYLSKQYHVGDILPANNPDMVEAWLEAGTAVWKNIEQTEAPKARLKTAEQGQPGVAVSSESEDGDNLIGRVPKTASRRKK